MLGAGDLATAEPEPERGARLPPVCSFSLKGSSAAAAQVLACRDARQ